MASAALMTVGYEGKSVQALLDQLLAAHVARVVDVRQLPLSRRRGFSKTALSTALAEAGIEYVHVRAAGNPFRHDDTSISAVLARFRRHVEAHPDVLTALGGAVASARSALLCFEADASSCHRSVLADLLVRPTDGRRVCHL
jgi:uncharacterized protein (DUF488 family)